MHSFKTKLSLFIGQLAQRKFDNFSHLKERFNEGQLLDTDKYASKLEALQDTFEERFNEFVGVKEYSTFYESIYFPTRKLV